MVFHFSVSLMIAWLSDLGQRCHKLLLQIVYCMSIMYYEGYKSFDSEHVHFYLFIFFWLVPFFLVTFNNNNSQ